MQIASEYAMSRKPLSTVRCDLSSDFYLPLRCVYCFLLREVYLWWIQINVVTDVVTVRKNFRNVECQICWNFGKQKWIRLMLPSQKIISELKIRNKFCTRKFNWTKNYHQIIFWHVWFFSSIKWWFSWTSPPWQNVCTPRYIVSLFENRHFSRIVPRSNQIHEMWLCATNFI